LGGKGVVLWIAPDRHPLAGATNTNESALISGVWAESIQRHGCGTKGGFDVFRDIRRMSQPAALDRPHALAIILFKAHCFEHSNLQPSLAMMISVCAKS